MGIYRHEGRRYHTTLRCDVDGFHFTVSKAKGADVPDEKVYVWLSDGTGAKREDISA